MSPYLQMIMQMQGQNPFASPQGGMPPSGGNMAPQIPVVQPRQGNAPPAPQQPIVMGQQQGAVGTANNGMKNIQSLYQMGNGAYNGISNMFGPGQTPPLGALPAMNGASNMSGQANAQNFLGPMGSPSATTSGMSSGMPAAGAAPNFSGYGMAGPTSGAMFGGQQGANAAFMNGGAGGMFGSGGASGIGAGGAAGSMFGAGGATGAGYGLSGLGGAAGTDAAGTAAGTAAGSSPTWISQIGDWLGALM